jgi:hypothetical protein
VRMGLQTYNVVKVMDTDKHSFLCNLLIPCSLSAYGFILPKMHRNSLWDGGQYSVRCTKAVVLLKA